MYEEGANAFQVILFLGSPVYGAIVGYESATRGQLRPSGGLALAAAIVFASIALMHAIEVVRAGGVAPYGVWGLALPISSLAAAALTGAAFYVRGPGRPRRAMFALAGLLFPLSAWPLIYSFGIFYVIAGWAVCFTLAAMNPPLRTSELRSRG